MALADDLSLRRIAVPGDWKQVVMDIEEGNVGQYVFFFAGQYAFIVREINMHRRDFETLTFSFEGTQSKMEVAKHALLRVTK
jgi:hypothetical protein